MRRDIAAFGVGTLAIAIGVATLWAVYAQVSWTWLSRLTPVVLIGIAVGMLLLSVRRPS